MIPTLEMAPHS